jgi:hypothetical protein
MEVTHRIPVHICVCVECGSALSVTEEGMARFRKRPSVAG